MDIGGVLGVLCAATYVAFRVRRELRSRAQIRSQSQGWRTINVNGRALLEAGAAEMLARFHPAFTALNVPALTGESQARNDGALILTTSDPRAAVTLFSPADLRRVPREAREDWRVSVVETRFLKVVNQHLAAHGKSDRCFTVWAGPGYRERQVVLLTPAMLKATMASSELPLFAKPDLADDVWDPLPSGEVSPARRRFCERLKAAGFFEKLTPTRAAELESRIALRGSVEMLRHPWRNMHADDEDIAEGGAADFLNSAARIFKRLGVPPLLGTLRQSENGAQLLDLPTEAGGVVTLLNEAELAAADSEGHSLWGLIPARLLIAINRYLAMHGSAERFYSVYGGNDAAVMVLTNEMFEAILELGDSQVKDLPYLRTEEAPLYGARGSDPAV